MTNKNEFMGCDNIKQSNKLHLDKYYTPPKLAKYCIEKTYEIIGEDNITETIEPSAGNGSFSLQIPNCIAYDIEPEHESIIKQDFLQLNISYKKGRLIIGNPPFGDRNNDLVKRFYNKSIQIADYIAFILPISQYKNKVNLYQFDLIHSENLGLHIYTDRELHCCFNIYKRPQNGFNKRPQYRWKDIVIKRHTRGSNEIYKKDFDYDLRICCRGNIGRVCDYENQYAKEYCIKIYNNELKKQIIDIIVNADWNKIYPSISSPYLAQWQIYEYLKSKIPNIK